MLEKRFFNGDAAKLAQALLGKVLRVTYRDMWLAALIIETEAYYQAEKASHASLGYTEKRKALFMSPGTIYMYYARGGDSLNVSARGPGNAVLIKSGFPYWQEDDNNSLAVMQTLNPQKNASEPRAVKRLCAGQTLLCRALNLKVPDWDQQQFCAQRFYIEDVGYQPEQIIQTTRLGIPQGRDEHLPYRFVDAAYAESCTRNPLRQQRFNTMGEA